MKSQLDMKFVLDTADKFGVPFEDVAQHFAHLELATRGTTLEGQKMRDMFQDITAYATRFGLTQQQLDTILNQVTESLTRQRINVQNLRGIMSSVPAAQSIAADAVAGGSQAVFEQMLKRGHVWAESFWADFWKSANQRYGVDPTKAVDNLFTSQGRFKNAILELNNAMNAALGFTDAYKSSLDLLTNTMHFLARNIDTVIKVVGVFGATLAGAILGYEIIAKGAAIISMFQALARAISLTGVAAMFAAGPMALIFGIGGAIAAGVGALVLLNSAIDTNRDKLLGTLPVIKDYIKAYEDSKKAGSERTAELLKEANAELIKAQASLVAATAMKESTAQAAKEAGAPAAKTWWDTFLNYFNEYGKSLGAEAGMSQALIDATNKAAASAATAQADEARKRVTDIQGDITKLQGMLKAQQDYEKSIKSTQHAPSAWDTRNSVTLREYNELLQNTVDQYNAMKESAKDAAAQIEQAQLDKTVEQWRKKFQELGYSMTEINKKTQTLSDALTKLQKAKDFDKDFMSLGQTLEYSFGTLGKDALDKFVTAMNNGTISSMKFRDFVVSGLEAVEKKILELAVLNPILNSLFGASNQTFSWFSGGTNTGGLIGKLLTAGGFQSGPAAAAIPTKVGAAGSMEVPTLHGGSGAPSFGFFDPSIFLGAPRLHSGLAPDEFPAILQDGETVTPKGARISGGDTFVNINGNYHDYNGGKDRAQQKQGLSAMRRELEGLIDSRLIEARRPGGIYNRVNNPFGSKT
jgi:tape measure domain-containing protein